MGIGLELYRAVIGRWNNRITCQVVRAASPVLLRVIALGAFFIYCTTIVMYPQPNIVTCTVRVWLREIGFSLTYGALMLKTWRISVIFRVRSAKAVKITDLDLLKRLGVIVAIFSVFLVIRTLVAPPHVIVGKTADDLKAYLCHTDYWDHSFTALEVMFLIWGIRLCIMVRKAPSEFNESRFISMAIYNEFLLSVFLNVSMLFLQSPANPDLLYIICFCHTQLTVTLLLGLIFGSKVYLVLRGHGKSDDGSGATPKPPTAKFLARPRAGNSQCAPSTHSSTAGQLEYSALGELDVQEEFQRLYAQLDMLKERNMRLGNRHLAAKISAMQEAARQPVIEEDTAPVTEHLQPNNVLAVAVLHSEDAGGLLPGGASPPQSRHSSVKSTAATECAAVSSAPTTVTTTATAEAEPPPTPAPDIELSSTCKKSSGRRKRSRASGSGTDAASTSAGTSDATSPGEHKKSRNLKSGHARTHAIIINLDDKNRFTEEVTV